MFIKKFENFFDYNDINFIIDLFFMELEQYGLIEVPKDEVTTSLSLDMYWSDKQNQSGPGISEHGYYCISKKTYNDDIDISMVVNERIDDEVLKCLKLLTGRLKKLGYKYTKFTHGKSTTNYYRYYIDLSKI